MNVKYGDNSSSKKILIHMLFVTLSFIFSGFGVYLTIHADIGASPWDVFTLGLSLSMRTLYGNAAIIVSVIVIVLDFLMREPIGIGMIIDAFVVGKTVDFFNYIDIIPVPGNLFSAIVMQIIGLAIVSYGQVFYMRTALGCGPRDALLVGLAKRLQKIPISFISIALLTLVTLVGWLLGGKVGVGTIVCAFSAGPIMQFAFRTAHFDVTAIHHQSVTDSIRVFIASAKT